MSGSRQGQLRKRKDAIWTTGGGVCHYCKRPPRFEEERTLDHIWPLSQGGSNARWNIVAACKMCNLRKGPKASTCECDHCRAAMQRHLDMGLAPGAEVPDHKRRRASEAKQARKRLGVRFDPETRTWGWYSDQMVQERPLGGTPTQTPTAPEGAGRSTA